MKKSLLFLFAIICSISLFAQPVITQNPQSNVVCIGACEDFTITAVGNSLTYHWQQLDLTGWNTVVSSSISSYTYCADSLLDSVLVRCVVEDNMGFTDTSNIAYLSTDSCLAPVANFEFQIFGDSVCFENTSLRAETVLWNFGNGGQPTDFSPCYDYMDFQIFTAKLYVFNDYGSDEIEKEIDLLGLEELSTRFELYPNPTSGQLYISSKSLIESIQVIGIQGNIVMDLNPNKAAVTMDLSSLNKGVYLVQMTVNGRLSHQKIILQ